MRLFLSAFIAFFLVFPVAMIKSAIDANPKKRKAEQERLLQLAIKRGHVVEAEFVKLQAFSFDRPDTLMQTGQVAIYEYQFGGRKYKFRVRTDDVSPFLTLYFVSNPRKAALAGALSDSKVSWPVVYAIAVAIIYLFVK